MINDGDIVKGFKEFSPWDLQGLNTVELVDCPLVFFCDVHLPPHASSIASATVGRFDNHREQSVVVIGLQLHGKRINFPDLPIDGQASDMPPGHGIQDASHGRPNRQQDASLYIS
ncbi:hypothetical protein IEQ34_008333 [Dendrobium chrysotoxum]|uniref:Uncharacterized protein n=1 Tax=Dendrobium chrysotoxum TaxID=161865 RepID=A0AAV7GYL2_DENCH|nr:hypothetical protein IEQ34_008333 [Dendrobium chrysotoxum]